MHLIKCFHNPSDSELALLIVDQVKGSAKDALDILQINDSMGSRGLEMFCQILDKAHAELVGDKFDEASKHVGLGPTTPWTETG